MRRSSLLVAAAALAVTTAVVGATAGAQQDPPLLEPRPDVLIDVVGTQAESVIVDFRDGLDPLVVSSDGSSSIRTVGGVGVDFDGDGHDDLVRFSPGPGPDAFLFGREDGGFDEVPFDARGDYLPLTAPGWDVDGDDRTDLFWYAAGPRPDYLFHGGDDRVFEATALSVVGDYNPILGDFDGTDGGDILYYRPGPGADYLASGDGEAGFAYTALVGLDDVYRPVVGSGPSFDGDGLTDILWYAPGPTPDKIWWGGEEGFEVSDRNINGTYITRVGDFDGDLDTDILFYGPGDAPDAFILGNPDRSIVDALGAVVRGDYLPVAAPGFDADGDDADDIFWYRPGTRTDYLLANYGFDGEVTADATVLDVTVLGLPVPGRFGADRIAETPG